MQKYTDLILYLLLIGSLGTRALFTQHHYQRGIIRTQYRWTWLSGLQSGLIAITERGFRWYEIRRSFSSSEKTKFAVYVCGQLYIQPELELRATVWLADVSDT